MDSENRYTLKPFDFNIRSEFKYLIIVGPITLKYSIVAWIEGKGVLFRGSKVSLI